jgi:hypothetical protein
MDIIKRLWASCIDILYGPMQTDGGKIFKFILWIVIVASAVKGLGYVAKFLIGRIRHFLFKRDFNSFIDESDEEKANRLMGKIPKGSNVYIGNVADNILERDKEGNAITFNRRLFEDELLQNQVEIIALNEHQAIRHLNDHIHG